MASEPLALARVTAPSGRRLLFAGLFFASGAAGLIDQVVWLRHLSLVFGNTTLAAATLIAVFLGGLGLGAAWFARLGDRPGGGSRSHDPLRVYALLELGIGIFALVSPRFFDAMNGAYVLLYRAVGDEPALFALLRALLAAVCLLPPTILMGATLPVLISALRTAPGREGRDTALLYGANTLGAAAGVAFAGFLSIRLFGLSASLAVAALLNFAVALTALLIRQRTSGSRAAGGGEPASIRGSDGSTRRPVGRRLLAIAFSMGALSIACEVLWTRVLVFYLGSSVYAFSLMLLLFLVGIAAGSFAAGRLVDRIARPLLALAALEIVLALLSLATVALFATLNARQIALSELLEPQTFAGFLAAQLLAVAPILLPPTLVMGFTFPLLVRVVSRGSGRLGADVGAVYGANTAGSIVGALGAGFALVPLLGSQNALLFTGAGNLAIALLFLRRSARFETPSGLDEVARDRARRMPRGLAFAASGTLVLLAAGAALLPPDRVILAAGLFASDRPGDLLHFHEDAQAAVAVRTKLENGRPWRSLELNGVNVAGTSPDLYAVQKLQGHLPLLLGGPERSRVVHIGFGSGGTAHAVSLHPVTEIRIIEISPAVLAASDRWFPEINHGVLADPRARAEINDGRNFLLATRERFDAVLSDSIHPRYAGNGSLYSEEYFRLVDRRLAPGGVVSMWLPMYSLLPSNYAMIVRAFTNVFPRATIWYEPSALNSFTIVTAVKGESAFDASALARGFARPPVAAALADLGIASPSELLASVLLTGDSLARLVADVPPHVDDLPAVEYESGTSLAVNWPWRRNFEILLALRPGEPPPELLAALPEGERVEFARRWRERGALLAAHAADLAAHVSPWS